jgi:hypothetical protein
MPIVTSPPILIDPVNFSRQSVGEINPMLALFGTTLYLILCTPQVLPQRIVGYKSVDDGASWTLLDSTNSPVTIVTSSQNNAYFNQLTGLIGVLYIGAAGGPIVSVLNTATGLWLAPGTEGGNAIEPAERVFFYQLSNSDYVYIGGGFFSNTLHAVKYSGGAWDGGTGTDTGLAGANVMGGMRDAADAAHIVYNDVLNGFLKYARVASDFSAGAPHTLLASGFGLDRASVIPFGADTVAIGYTDQLSVFVSIGTPLAAAVFTDYTIQTVGGSAAVSYVTLAVGNNGKLVVRWTVTDQGVNPEVDEIRESTLDGGVWSAPVVFYDEITNPPANAAPSPFQFVHTGDMLQLASGVWVFATAMETIPPDDTEKCTGLILLGGSNVPVPRVTISGALLMVRRRIRRRVNA